MKHNAGHELGLDTIKKNKTNIHSPVHNISLQTGAKLEHHIPPMVNLGVISSGDVCDRGK